MATDTYNAIGNKEDVSEIITNIAPDETPIYSRIGRVKATQTKHEWLEDDLGDADDNAQVEGYTYFTVSAKPRNRLYNYTQIMHRGVQVTDSQEAVLHYGIRSEMAYQMQKKMNELAFDCERAIIKQNTQLAGSFPPYPSSTPPATPRQFGGLPFWIITNVLSNGGTPRGLTFTLINSALEQTWSAGGKPSILLLSPTNKRVVSTMTANSTKYMEGNKTRKLTHMISVLESDFGTIQCLTDRFMPNDVVYGLSPEYIKKAFLRPFKTGDIPKINDMGRKMINGEWTLEMRAEKAHFKIEDLDGIVPDEG